MDWQVIEITPENKKSLKGDKFPSKFEAQRYIQLARDEQPAGLIRELETQKRFKLHAINGDKVCEYIADFVYERKLGGVWIKTIEDTKGMQTPIFDLKWKWMKIEYPGYNYALTKELRKTKNQKKAVKFSIWKGE